MPLLGTAAMLLCFDVVAQTIAEHDDWHTHEHLPERLAIPGFLRGTRWVALEGQPRYLVLYEVAQLDTLASPAYLERLNHPTPWTARMMPHYRGMTRGLCSVVASTGFGSGHVAWLGRFRAAPGADARLGDWLVQQVLPTLPQRAGLGGAHVLRGTMTPQMTNEQRIRGADAGVDWAVLITAYDPAALASLAQTELGPAAFEAHGAVDLITAHYRMDYTLISGDINAGPPSPGAPGPLPTLG